ncbi:unnamed protein product [Brachionus calyciflorus]|uniref:Uncharacterized protein n=1 Tax=Brachionus calyciflorus TaxID=104777 RepID=A0A814MGR1_9BILA|nr:unnamed protein product [Brachionus calyciflorus]
MYQTYQQYVKPQQVGMNSYSSYTNFRTYYPQVHNQIMYNTLPRKASSNKQRLIYAVESVFEPKHVYKSDSAYEAEIVDSDDIDEIDTSEEELDKTLEEEENTLKQDALDPEFDMTLENLIYEIDNKKLSHKTLRRIERNQSCLSILIEGDLIEYVKDESDMESQNSTAKWAIYMGNSKIMRFDVKMGVILYESYWKIAKNNYIFINRDLDKRLMTLPIYETLKKARKAYENQKKYIKLFSSDKNFCTWCRFNINKSDIDFSTDVKNGIKMTSTEAKEFLLNKFLNSLDLAQD